MNRFREARDSPGFLWGFPSYFFTCYDGTMASQIQFPDELLGPFSAAKITESTLGPFAQEAINKAMSPWDARQTRETDRPMLESMGVTPQEFRSLLDSHEGAREMLSQPEAEALHAYLKGNQKYDVGVLNNLFAELAAGFRARMAARDQVLREMRQPRAPRSNPHAPSWPLEGTSTRATRADSGPWMGATPPAEIGEPVNPPIEWWLEGK